MKPAPPVTRTRIPPRCHAGPGQTPRRTPEGRDVSISLSAAQTPDRGALSAADTDARSAPPRFRLLVDELTDFLQQVEIATLEETPWLAPTPDTTQRLPLRTDDPEP